MCSARSSTGWTVIWASGLAHHAGPARRSPAPGPPGPGRVRRRRGPRRVRGGRAAPPRASSVAARSAVIGWLQVQGELVAGQVAGRDGAAYVQGLGGAGQQLLVGIGREGGVEVDRVGQVEVALGVHRARGETWARSTSIRRESAAASRSASACSGSNRAIASSTSRVSCASPILCATAATWASTNAAASGERHMVRSAIWASFHAGRSPASSRAQHSQSRYLPSTTCASSGARPRSTSPTRPPTPPPRTPPPRDTPRHRAGGPSRATRRPDPPGLTRVHRRPVGGCLHDLAGLVVLGPLVRPRSGQHRGGVVGSGGLERVEGGGHRGTNSSIDHRQSTAPIPLYPQGFRDRDPTVIRGQQVPTLRWSRQARPAGRPVPARAAEATPLGPQPARRRQPDSQPAFGPRRGCQPAPEPSEGTQD